jgi:hypothetical protein
LAKRYVRQNRKGRWEVLEEGQRRSLLQADTKKDALARARAIVKRSGGGEIRVVNKVGKVVNSSKIGRTAVKSRSARSR